MGRPSDETELRALAHRPVDRRQAEAGPRRDLALRETGFSMERVQDAELVVCECHAGLPCSELIMLLRYQNAECQCSQPYIILVFPNNSISIAWSVEAPQSVKPRHI